MATIRRKPVSSAFYESDFPPLFRSGPTRSASSTQPETSTPVEARSESNNSSGPALQDEVLTGNESQYRLLDNDRATGHNRSSSCHSTLEASVSQITQNTNHIENVSKPPAGDHDHDPERLIQHRRSGQQNRSPESVSSGLLWNPFWLKKGTLVAFIVLYIALLASVTLLWRVSQDQDGFTPHISTNHYTWTYGPTAILIMVVGLWRQVEYHCKVLAPWHELKRGAGASRSLLLDYVSPFQLTSLWLAFKHGAMPVIAAITGFACLKLVVSFARASQWCHSRLHLARSSSLLASSC
jgi:Protein of unknown function (DUF3433)